MAWRADIRTLRVFGAALERLADFPVGPAADGADHHPASSRQEILENGEEVGTILDCPSGCCPSLDANMNSRLFKWLGANQQICYKYVRFSLVSAACSKQPNEYVLRVLARMSHMRSPSRDAPEKILPPSFTE